MTPILKVGDRVTRVCGTQLGTVIAVVDRPNHSGSSTQRATVRWDTGHVGRLANQQLDLQPTYVVTRTWDERGLPLYLTPTGRWTHDLPLARVFDVRSEAGEFATCTDGDGKVIEKPRGPA